MVGQVEMNGGGTGGCRAKEASKYTLSSYHIISIISSHKLEAAFVVGGKGPRI